MELTLEFGREYMGTPVPLRRERWVESIEHVESHLGDAASPPLTPDYEAEETMIFLKQSGLEAKCRVIQVHEPNDVLHATTVRGIGESCDGCTDDDIGDKNAEVAHVLVVDRLLDDVSNVWTQNTNDSIREPSSPSSPILRARMTPTLPTLSMTTVSEDVLVQLSDSEGPSSPRMAHEVEQYPNPQLCLNKQVHFPELQRQYEIQERPMCDPELCSDTSDDELPYAEALCCEILTDVENVVPQIVNPQIEGSMSSSRQKHLLTDLNIVPVDLLTMGTTPGSRVLKVRDIESARENSHRATATARRARCTYEELRRAVCNPIEVVPGAMLESALGLLPPSTKRNIECIGEEYKSRTQEKTTSEILLGSGSGGDGSLSAGVLTIWESDTTLHWAARLDGWVSRARAARACATFWRAAHAWEGALQGRVRFRYVQSLENADIQLAGRDETKAFFPDAAAASLLTLALDRSDERRWYPVLLHEIGHILGLYNRDLDASRLFPACARLWGARAESCVSDRLSAQVHHDDALALREAYDTLDDGQILRGVGPCAHVVRTVRRVRPHSARFLSSLAIADIEKLII